MSYYVSLGDIELDQVLTVAQSGERDISTYDSVGGGKFAVAQNKGLREWTIKCEINDHDLIDDLDDLQKRKSPFRLVISGGDYKISKRVFLKSYSREEEYAGVFPTTLKLTEYVKAGVKTTSVPYVAREGNAVLPAQVTIGDGTGTTQTSYDLEKAAADQAKYDGEANARAPQYEVLDPETGKPWDNPVTIPDGATVSLYTYQDRVQEKDDLRTGVFGGTATDNILTKTVSATFKAMSTAFNYYEDKFNERATGG